MRDFYKHQEEKYKLIPDPAAMLNNQQAELNQTLQLFGFTAYGWVRSVLAGIVLSAAFSFSFQAFGTLQLQHLVTAALIGTIAGPVVYAYLFSLMRVTCLKKLRKLELQEASDDLQKGYPANEVIAEQVYRAALCISIGGFMIVIAGILMMLYKETEQAYLVISTGIIGECLSAVFFSFYTKMIARITVFQQKPYHLKFD